MDTNREKKTGNLIKRIKNESETNRRNTKNHLEELSERQKQVFELILNGKSNKEIMEELSIELSTLKTHINKLYKTPGIENRKQLRNYKP